MLHMSEYNFSAKDILSKALFAIDHQDNLSELRTTLNASPAEEINIALANYLDEITRGVQLLAQDEQVFSVLKTMVEHVKDQHIELSYVVFDAYQKGKDNLDVSDAFFDGVWPAEGLTYQPNTIHDIFYNYGYELEKK